VAAEWETRKDGTFKLISGSPNIRDTGQEHQIAWDHRSSGAKEEIYKKIHAIQEALFALEENILPYVHEVLGPAAGWDHLLFNRVGGWIPDNLEFINDYIGADSSSQKRKALDLLARKMARAFALSERYATTEQEWNRKLAEAPSEIYTMLTSPDAGLARLTEVARDLYNELEWQLSKTETDGVTARTVKRMHMMPSGAKNDPYVYETLGHIEHLQKYMVNINDKSKKHIWIQMSPATLKAKDYKINGANNLQWKDHWDTQDRYIKFKATELGIN
jgi:hypothetical protein